MIIRISTGKERVEGEMSLAEERRHCCRFGRCHGGALVQGAPKKIKNIHPGDVLREDELNFMDVPLNFYVFTGSSENLTSTFQRKIFYLAMEESDFQMLESQAGLEKISDNLVSDHHEIIGVPEYGIMQHMQLEDLKILQKKFPALIFTNSFS